MDEAALVAVYERTVDEVYRYARRLVAGDCGRAEDLTQEAYLSLVRELRLGRDDVATVAWLVTCVRNRFIDGIRRDRRGERALRLVWSNDVAPTDQTVPAMAEIDDVARAAVVLHHIDGYPVAEVAAMIGRSTRATESLLARARGMLRREMEGRSGHG